MTPKRDDLEAVRLSYDRLAPRYDRRWRKYIDRSLSKIISVANLQGTERVLDVACGTGEMEKRLLEHWPALHITAVDLSANMLAQAQAKRLPGDVRWQQGEATTLPADDRSLDLVLCANSFHYFREPEACLREFRRCLAPGGRLILVDWCDDYILCKLCGLWLRLTDPAYFCTYTQRALHSMLTATGYSVLHEERFRASWLWGMMIFVATGSV